MKILIFSDIHGNIYPLYHMIDSGLFNIVDYSIFCGDIFGYYYNQNEIIDIFKNMDNLYMILGNHDKLFLDMLDNKINKNILIKNFGKSYDLDKYTISNDNISFLQNLQESIDINIDNKNINVVHGGFYDNLNDRVYPDSNINLNEKYKIYNYIFLGHTHYKMNLSVGGTKIINPGSLGQPRDNGLSSYVIVDTQNDSETFHFVKYDKSKLISEVVQNNEISKYSLDILYRGECYE